MTFKIDNKLIDSTSCHNDSECLHLGDAPQVAYPGFQRLDVFQSLSLLLIFSRQGGGAAAQVGRVQAGHLSL